MAFKRIEATVQKTVTGSGRTALVTRPGSAGAYAFFVLSFCFAAALVLGLIP